RIELANLAGTTRGGRTQLLHHVVDVRVRLHGPNLPREDLRRHRLEEVVAHITALLLRGDARLNGVEVVEIGPRAASRRRFGDVVRRALVRKSKSGKCAHGLKTKSTL